MSLCRPCARTYICTGCLQSLSRERSRLRFNLNDPWVQLKRSLSTSVSVRKVKPTHKAKIKRTKNEQEEDRPALSPHDRPTKRPPLRSHAWAAPLANKSLGQNSSVLVLRDSETKRKRRKEEDDTTSTTTTTAAAAAPQQPDPLKVDTDGILSSMHARQSKPTQSEVFEKIDAMRPRNQTLPTKDFHDCFKALVNSFSYSQLRSYAQTQVHNYKGPRQEIIQDERNPLIVKPWKISGSRSSLPLKANKHGKIFKSPRERAAHEVLRAAWGVQVDTELASPGVLYVLLKSTETFPVLRRTNRQSRLRELKHAISLSSNPARGAKIHFDEDNRRFVISGTQYQCLQAVDQLERLFQDSYTLDSEKGPLADYPWKSIREEVELIARSCLCTIKTQPGERLTISARDRLRAESCLRLLFASFPREPRKTHQSFVLIKGDTEDTSMMQVHTATSRFLKQGSRCLHKTENLKLDSDNTEAESQPVSYLSWSKGRPRSLSAGSGYREMVNWLLHGGQPGGKTTNQDGPSEAPAATSTRETAELLQRRISLRAEFGHLLYQHVQNPSLETPSRRELFNPLNRTFSPALQGFLSLLCRDFAHVPAIRGEIFRIRLRPALWKMKALPSTYVLPDLEMKLFVDAQSRTLAVKEMRALTSTKATAILDPGRELDMQIVREDSTLFSNPESDAGVVAFLQEMGSLAERYNQLFPPLSLKTKLPGQMLSSTSNSKDRSLHEVANNDLETEYFAEGLEFEERVSWHHENCELHYHRVQAGAPRGIYEAISLQPATFDGHGEYQGMPEGQISKSQVGQLIRKANALLERLNDGVGDQEMITRKLAEPLVRSIPS